MPIDPTVRRACAWCDEPSAWPDRCGIFRGDETCAEITEDKCVFGDHRRCDGPDCAVAARFHLEVRRTGARAAQAAGSLWAVVSIIGDRVSLVGTTDHLGRAKSTLRTPELKRHGLPTGPEGKGLVYVVRAYDGEFF